MASARAAAAGQTAARSTCASPAARASGVSVGGAWGWPARSAAAAPLGALPGRPPARRRGRSGRPDNQAYRAASSGGL